MKAKRRTPALGEMTDARRSWIDARLKAGKTVDEIIDAAAAERLKLFPTEPEVKLGRYVAALRTHVEDRVRALGKGGDLLVCPVHGPVRLVDLRLSQKAEGTRDLAFSIPVRGRGVVARAESDFSIVDDGLYHLVDGGKACRAVDVEAVRDVLGDFDDPE